MKIKNNISVIIIAPIGVIEFSPAIYRWEFYNKMDNSPVGTAEKKDMSNVSFICQ